MYILFIVVFLLGASSAKPIIKECKNGWHYTVDPSLDSTMMLDATINPIVKSDNAFDTITWVVYSTPPSSKAIKLANEESVSVYLDMKDWTYGTYSFIFYNTPAAGNSKTWWKFVNVTLIRTGSKLPVINCV